MDDLMSAPTPPWPGPTHPTPTHPTPTHPRPTHPPGFTGPTTPDPVGPPPPPPKPQVPLWREYATCYGMAYRFISRFPPMRWLFSAYLIPGSPAYHTVQSIAEPALAAVKDPRSGGS